MASRLQGNILRSIFSLLILLCLGSSEANAFQDQHITSNQNVYKRVVGGAVLGTDFVIVDDPTNFSKFAAGDTVLLIQMRGVTSNATEEGSYGNYVGLSGSPGLYEFLIVSTTDPGTLKIWFKNNLVNDYNVNSDVQLIRVPSYYSVQVDATLTCQPWDSATKTGGVLTMIVGKTLKLNHDIDVSGKGFTGGAPVIGDGICTELSSNLFTYDTSFHNSGLKGDGLTSLGWIWDIDHSVYFSVYAGNAKGRGANFTAAGAGNGRFSGGGGGSNYGSGGTGGREDDGPCGTPSPGGVGGRQIRSLPIAGRIFMGGGGGGSTWTGTGVASPGGRGGGIVIILCNELDGNGHSIKANGLKPAFSASGTAGAGGGGAGGTVALYLETFSPNLITLSASGGTGGDNSANTFGEGGGGGGGLILTNNIAYPSNVTTSFAGGIGGTSLNINSTPGAVGAVLKTFGPTLNGFLFNTIRSSGTGNLADSICSNNVPYPVLGTTPVGGSGSYVFLWQKRNTGSTIWANIPSSDVQNYTFAATEPDTFAIRRVVKDNTTFLTDTSKEAIIVVQPIILNNHVKIYSDIISLTDTVCFGDNPKLIDQYLPDIFVPTTKNLFYTWQDSSQTTSWGSTLAATKSYDPNPSGGLQKTTWYRRKVVSGRCADSTAIVKFTVLPVIGSDKISATQEICHGTTFANLTDTTGSVLTGGDNTYRYQWLKSATGSAGSWNTATGTTTNALYDPPESGTDTEVKTYFRRVVYSGIHNVCQDSSNSVKLTEWKKISNNSITSLDQTICSGSRPDSLIASVPSDGNHTYTFTWQQMILSGSFGIASGPYSATTKNYWPPNLTDSTWYRRIVASSACRDTSNIRVVNVHKPITNNKIALLSALADTTICVNQIVPVIKGADPSGGTNNPVDDIFLWQVSSPGNNTWVTAPAPSGNMSYSTGTHTNVTVNPLFYYYRRSFTSGQCSTYSDTVTVKVLPKITNNVISADQAVCYNTSPAQLTGPGLSGGDASVLTWLWQQSTTGSAPWVTAANVSNSQNYSPPALTSPTYYRRWIYSGLSNCCKDSSNVLNITINPLPVSTIAAAIDTICEGTSKTFSLSISGSTSSPWTVIYKETYLKNNTSDTTTVPVNAAGSTIPVNPAIVVSTTDSASFAYTISKVTDSHECDAVSMTGSRKLVVYKVPGPDAGADVSVCGPEYMLAGVTNVGTGRWFYPTIPVVDSVISGNNFTATVDSTLTGLQWKYRFYWKVKNWTCQAKDSIDVTFYRRATKADAGPDKVLYSFDDVDTLHAAKPLVGDGVWSVVSGGGTVQDSLVRDLSEENVFEWKVTNGVCVSTDQMTLTVYPLVIPNAFSPNGDNINDEFDIKGLDLNYSQVSLTILNSAGAQVYHTENSTWKPWNGENEKGPLPDGTYYYLLTIKSTRNNKVHKESGFIILKRDKR